MELTGIAHQIWDEKYRFKNQRGEPIDQTIEDTWKRVAVGLSAAEKHDSLRDRYATEFYDALSDFSVLPAGRITAGAGTGRGVTLLNCFVMGEVPDSLTGIHDMLKYTAKTMQAGGGTGTDFSTLRPKGALVESLGVGASGPLSFMDNWDSMCKTIMSAGHRRGAMMGTLRCDHPDIEDFIEAKRDPARWRNFNVSVLITDAFMDAVRADVDWSLHFKGEVYKVVRARELWDKIMRATYDCADPGVLFIDRMNATNPLRYAETLTCTNPCAEEPLPPWGACCLGSVNLTRIVVDPFTSKAHIDSRKLERSTKTLVRMLDNVIDVTNYPLEFQRHEMEQKRRIGVGITGFADMLAMLGVAYSSARAVEWAREVTAQVALAANEASVALGEEKGSFPVFDVDQYDGKFCPFAKTRRNSHLTAIAPTGTISLLAGNISSGIEPIFALILKRKLRQPDDTWKEVEISDYALEEYKTHCGGTYLASRALWETVADLKPEHHLAILAACQANVDTSISKTINCPESITFEDFKDIYLKAYESGVKCCATYRPNQITGSILTSESMSSEAPVSNVVELTKPLTRPEAIQGTTYRLKPPGLEHALFITINDIDHGGRRQPFEIFINTKNLEFLAWSTALTRMISAIFRRGGDVAFITDELKAVFDPRGGGYWQNEQYVPSVIAGIGGIIEQHLTALGVAAPQPVGKRICPKCGDGLVQQEGCWSCRKCTYSACG